MKTQTKKTKVKTVLKEIIFPFITIDMLLNGVLYTHILVDSECLCFGMMTKKTVEWNKLKWFSVSSWRVIDVMGKTGTIDEMTKVHINVNKYIKICYFYVRRFPEEGRQQVGAVPVPRTDGGVREQCTNVTIYGQL